MSSACGVQRRRPEEREPHFLTRLVDRLPRLLDPKADSYTALLDQALLDRHISASEADGLVAAAGDLVVFTGEEARQYRIPIVHPEAYKRLAGAGVDAMR
ncbi:hypothetical protein AB0J83_44665 [Actinoplanes sp. NPDC049596]|uniref:hypothetical protein n=1 Tax=unclassified Actinoplanes TaxID=2626549 RepID=UPI00342BE01C